jgi:hypothetical protein
MYWGFGQLGGGMKLGGGSGALSMVVMRRVGRGRGRVGNLSFRFVSVNNKRFVKKTRIITAWL